MGNKLFLNGKYVPLEKACISVLDRGFLYGDGVFETMRAYKGKVFKIDEHLARLKVSLLQVKIRLPYGMDALKEKIYGTLRKNKLADAYVKVVVTRGHGAMGVDIPRRVTPTVVIYALRFKPAHASLYKAGVKIDIPCIRRNQESFVVRIKSLNYLDNILARSEVRARGFYEAVLLNWNDIVTEAATSNVFVVRDGVVYTSPPSAGLLPGVTREVVIGLIRKYLDKPCVEQNITLKMLVRADEVFLTNSTYELVPVVRVGRYTIGRVPRGKPGPMCKLLSALYTMEVSHGYPTIPLPRRSCGLNSRG
ncbi:MAG: aminotransferase class IV [Candidatus Omnitrophica bacterium]|nr:aminotransferase class IV [Candidatus Omnitrophota bacterium]